MLLVRENSGLWHQKCWMRYGIFASIDATQTHWGSCFLPTEDFYQFLKMEVGNDFIWWLFYLFCFIICSWLSYQTLVLDNSLSYINCSLLVPYQCVRHLFLLQLLFLEYTIKFQVKMFYEIFRHFVIFKIDGHLFKGITFSKQVNLI